MTHTCPYCEKEFEHNGGGKPRKTCGSKECQKAHDRARHQTEEYKAYQRAYQRAYGRARKQTEEYKAYDRAYRQTEERKAYMRAYRQTEKRKAYKREYERQQRNAATINEMVRIITQAQESRP